MDRARATLPVSRTESLPRGRAFLPHATCLGLQ
ncbi:hypothetical protein ACVWZF_001728, partial [Thermostichus sp. OS-CIW-30]